MKKKDFEGWMSLPVTREFFQLAADRVREQNQDFLLGKLREDNNDISMKYYDQIVGYNKAINDMATMDYYNLTGITEDEDDDEGTNTGRTEGR